MSGTEILSLVYQSIMTFFDKHYLFNVQVVLFGVSHSSFPFFFKRGVFLKQNDKN